MTFFEAVAKCYRKYFKFKGRASKSEFWWFVLVSFLFAWPLRLAETGEGTWYSILTLIYFLLTLSIIVPLMAVWTRRMHDVGRSGLTWLFLLIPIVGLLLLVRWTTKDGDMEANRYGEPDNDPFVTSIKKEKSNLE